MKKFERLLNLQTVTEQAGADMAEQRGRFDNLRNRHSNGTAKQVITGFNLFVTPQPLAKRMAELIPADASTILEPSAGTGRLYNEISDYEHVTLIENSPACCGELYNLTGGRDNVELLQRDFLEVKPFNVDCVIMNPPFKMGRDIKHIKHALKFLYHGGLLIALCYDGVRQNKILKPMADTWEVLPAGMFKPSGTSADVVLLTITKVV